MAKNLTSAVKAFAVSVDGTIDLEASVQAYRNAAEAWMAEQAAEAGQGEAVAAEVLTLFGRFPGAHLNLDFIKSQVANKLASDDPAANSAISKRVEEFVKGNTDHGEIPGKEGEASTPAKTDGLFTAKKGAKGGYAAK